MNTYEPAMTNEILSMFGDQGEVNAISVIVNQGNPQAVDTTTIAPFLWPWN